VTLAAAAVVSASFAGVALAQTPSIDVSDQKLQRRTVTLADVNLPARGYIAIHASDASGKMTDRIIGYATLRAGDHKNVKVRLSGAHKAGETLWAVAHQSQGRGLTNMRGSNRIGSPFMQNGQPVDKSFQIL